MRKPSAILFDWDNTLVDSWVCIHEAMGAVLRAMGHAEWSLEETKDRVALSMRDSFPKMFGERWQEARDVFYTSFEAIHLSYLTPLPGAADSVRRLAAAGIPLGVVSNKTGRYIREETAHLGWGPHFQKVLGAGDAAADKPSPAPVEMALQAIGVAADENVWFIGDAPVDMACARNSGISGVLVRHDPWEESIFADCPPKRKFRSWVEFNRFLDEILVP